MKREDGAASKDAPNKPFHLTPGAKGERQRSANQTGRRPGP
jgi:hypothetical protein